jgi:NAD(P)H-hydrate epimerase
MRQAEQECVRRGIPTSLLMENAGRAVAEAVRDILRDAGKMVLILVGPGNNGGDGLVAGRYLHNWGVTVCLYLMRARSPDDPNLKAVVDRGIETVEAGQDNGLARLEERLRSADVVLDAVFGTGIRRTIAGHISGILTAVGEEKARRRKMRIVALDLPSGMDADTGVADPSCLYADETVVLGFPKVGLFNVPGADRVGRMRVVDIGIPTGLDESGVAELASDDWVRLLLPPRPIVANKGTFGRVMVVAGSTSYPGAAYLACTGALRVGAGLVTLAAPASIQPVLSSKLTEVTHLPWPESGTGGAAAAVATVRRGLGGYNVLLVGPGLGQSPPATRLVRSLLLGKAKTRAICVVDADGLNILAKQGHPDEVWRRLADDAILTPHPGEMARLMGIEVGEIQRDRIAVARTMAGKWHKTVVLKGAYTVVAAPDGRVTVSPFANPALASGGTGDVLAGAISGLLSQGMTLFEAAAAGVYLHGKAGEMVSRKLGDAGVVASDILAELPLAIREIKRSG